jgi:UDP-glucose 4-epimerase
VIYGTGQQTRDYIYIDDVVEALAIAGTAEGLNQQVINIGTGVGTNIYGLVRLIEQVTGKKARTITNPSASGGVSTLVADTTRARQLLGFSPKITLEEGLRLLRGLDRQFAL